MKGRRMNQLSEAVKTEGELCLLEKAGMDEETLQQFVSLTQRGEDAAEEQIRMLRRCRCQLLEEIHVKQRQLDQLDYWIHRIKSRTGLAEGEGGENP